MPLNFETLQALEKRVREAESLIRHLRRENLRLTERLEEAVSERTGAGDRVHDDLPVVDPQVLLEQRSRIRSSIHRMLNLLDRIEH